MFSKEVVIKTVHDVEHIKEILNKILKSNPSAYDILILKRYKGEMKGNDFIFFSNHNPPITIRGKIVEGYIQLNITWDSIKSDIKRLIYVVCYLFLALILVINLKYEKPSYFTLFLIFMAFILPKFVYKSYLLFSHVEPNPYLIINDIRKKINGVIEF
jgi:hypothetical protein